ncbi:MAG: hypothetical protein M3O03_11635 [Pseudomonadota bacterium]|nr:hypothetical protein [Pseudomonadota bacterium]
MITPIQTTIAAIYAYISAVWAGTEDPFWPHVVLISASVAAGFAVGAGIIFEGAKYSEKTHRTAVWFVILGIAIESVCTVGLFVIDERISNAQQSKIIALETRLAPRWLTLDECKEVSAAMVPFSGKTVRVQSYALDAEGSDLAKEIIDCMEGSKTLNVEHALASIVPLGGFGSGVFVDGSDKELVAAIKDVLGVKAKLIMTPGSGWFVGNIGNGTPDTPPDANVVVGVKPVPQMKIE